MLNTVIYPLQRFVLESSGATFLTMEDVDELTDSLYDRVAQEGFSPDLVVGVLRGGYYPAKRLAKMFGSQRADIDVSRRDLRVGPFNLNDLILVPKLLGFNNNNVLPELGQSLPDLSDYERILLVDDDAVSGETLEVALKEVSRVSPVADIRTGVLISTEGCHQANYSGEHVVPNSRFLTSPKRFPWLPYSPHLDSYKDAALNAQIEFA